MINGINGNYTLCSHINFKFNIDILLSVVDCQT